MKKVTLFVTLFLFNLNLLASSQIINSKQLSLGQTNNNGYISLLCKDSGGLLRVVLKVYSSFASRVRRKLIVAQTGGFDIEFRNNISHIHNDYTFNSFVVKERARRVQLGTPELREEYKLKQELLLKSQEIKRAQDLKEREVRLEEDRLRQEQNFKREQLRASERMKKEELRQAQELAAEKERKEKRRKKSRIYNPESIQLICQKSPCGKLYSFLIEEFSTEEVQVPKELYKHILSKKRAASARRSVVAFHWDDFYDYLKYKGEDNQGHQELEKIVWAVESSYVEGVPEATVVETSSKEVGLERF